MSGAGTGPNPRSAAVPSPRSARRAAAALRSDRIHAGSSSDDSRPPIVTEESFAARARGRSTPSHAKPGAHSLALRSTLRSSHARTPTALEPKRSALGRPVLLMGMLRLHRSAVKRGILLIGLSANLPSPPLTLRVPTGLLTIRRPTAREVLGRNAPQSRCRRIEVDAACAFVEPCRSAAPHVRMSMRRFTRLTNAFRRRSRTIRRRWRCYFM